MKKILIQLDTDEHPSTFDAIVAHDADVDVLLRYGGIEPDAVQGLVQSAFFTRGPKDLATLAVWVGGSSVGAGEEVLAEVEKAFFGPFRVSAMLDSNGCNTTAATTVARLAAEIDLKGRRVVIVGAGAVGLRAAALLTDEGCEVTVSGIPASRFGDKPYRRARGLDVAEERGMKTVEPEDDEELAKILDGASLVLAAGPAGVELLPESIWQQDRLDRGARRLQRGRAARDRGHRGPGRARGPRRQARARSAGDRRAEDEGPQGVRAAAVRVQRRDPRRRRRLRDREGAARLTAGPRVAGIDPGTVSFEVCALDGGLPLLEESFPSAELGADPAPLVDALRASRALRSRARPCRATACRSSRPRRSASASSR